MSGFVWYWPLLFVVSGWRPRTRLRRLLLGLTSVFCGYLFLLLSFTGYAMPEGLPRSLPPREAAWALRFFILHVATLPLLSLSLLLVLVHRHNRALKGAA